MMNDQLRSAFDALRTRLQAELDLHIAAIEEHHAASLGDAQRTWEAEAEERWIARQQALQDEWTARLQAELARAHADAKRQLTEEIGNARAQAEQMAAGQIAALREELTAGRESERLRLSALLDEQRTRAEQASAERDRVQEQVKVLHERMAASDELRAQADAALAAEHERHARELDTMRQEVEAARILEREQFAHEIASLRQAMDDVSRARDEADAARQATEEQHAREMEHVRQQSETALAAERQRFDRETAALRDTIAEALRARTEADAAREHDVEQHAHEIESIGQQSDAALAAERERVEREIASARDGILDALRARDEALTQASAQREQHHAERERQARDLHAARRLGMDALERVSDAVQSISATRSLSGALVALLAAVSTETRRAAIFIVNGSELQRWKTAGLDGGAIGDARVALNDDGVLARAVRSSSPVRTSSTTRPVVTSLALPLMVGGQTVAVLYADDAPASVSNNDAPASVSHNDASASVPNNDPAASVSHNDAAASASTDDPTASASENADAPVSESWPSVVQILAQHASVCLAHWTAFRTVQLTRGTARHASPRSEAAPTESSAERYARLLVSEIKLYNEAAVRAGRERGDLLARLRPEIERARRLFEERVPAANSHGAVFQQELVRTLAGGNPTLLGGSA
jgi:hypothetical protein